MLFLLASMRARSVWNSVRFSTWRDRAITAGLSLGGAVLAVAVFLGLRLGLGLTHGHGDMTSVVRETCFYLFLFLLAGSTPFVASTVLYSSDFPIVCTAPIAPRAIIGVRVLEAAVVNSVQFVAIGLPAVAALGDAIRLPFLGWMLVVPLTAVFIVLPAVITSLVLLVAVWLVGSSKVRAAIAAVNALMGMTVCLIMVGQVSRLRLRGGAGLLSMDQVDPPAFVGWGPWAWFADSMSQASVGDWSTSVVWAALLVGCVGVLYGAAIAVGEVLMLRGHLAEPDMEAEGRGTAKHRGLRRGMASVLDSPAGAVMAKDMRCMARDSLFVSQVCMPAILLLVPFVLAAQDSMRTLARGSDLYPYAAVMAVLVLFMQASIISESAIGLEGRAFGTLMSSPNGPITVLWAKWLLSGALSGGIACAALVSYSVVFGIPMARAVGHGLVVLVAAFALCGIGLGISAAIPKFVFENPAHRVSPWALVLGFAAYVGYTGIAGGILACGWYLSARLPDAGTAVWVLIGICFVTFSLACAMASMALGVARLLRYEWFY